ncbi:LysE family transporter [Solibaculum mannosilyticum]|uniref:Membrane protein n=1 Tax=Solibaculum mannosilyticum TaxID=2780922 RepID=A0A7I8D7J6_9FIRM|nr:LysE family transporter [Solibaculum mannosilyticum]BCI60604.1 membrane protein [Solibaculum mannosilyticum]
MTLSLLGTMLGYMTVSSYTPGPGNILAMNTTTKFGWKKSKRLILGICCGYLCVQFLCTLTLYCLNHVLEPALAILKYIGAVYMLWLSFHIIRSHPQTTTQEKTPTFQTGFLLQLVNVKIYFYIMTLLTVYLIPNIKSLVGLFVSGIGIVSFGSIACLAWAALGLQLQGTYVKHFKIINFILGLFLLYCVWNIIRS